MLKTVEASFKFLAEISPTGIYLTDIKGKCLYVNPAWCNMAGLTVSEALGDGWVKAIHPLDRERIQAEWENFVCGGIPWNNEYRFIDKKEKITWVYGTATLFKNEKGVRGIIGINLDITGRKNSEIEIKESESKFRAIFDNAPIGISIIENGRISAVNQTMERFVKLTEEELKSGVGKNRVYINAEGKVITSGILPGLTALRENLPVEGAEVGIVEENGDVIWTEVSAAPLDMEGKHAVVIIQDITERKTLQKNLSESEAKYRMLMENSGLGIGYYDMNGKILMFNNEAIKNLGGTLSDYIGKNLTDIFGKKDGELYIDRLKLNAESEIPIKYEDHVKMGGRPGWYLSTHSRIYNQYNEIEGILVISDNITEQKNAEKKLKESQQKLKNLTQHLENIREEERSAIALNLHDDLGQTLTALNLDISWLKGRIGVQTREVGRKLTEMSSLINETIESIRELSSFLRPSILYELGLIPAFDWHMKKIERQSGIRCHFTYKSENIKIEDHIALILYRILQETLTNIIRHAKASEAGIILESDRNTVELSIKDNGKGIDADKVNSFKSFGLIGIKERVQSVGGTVRIHSEKGSGTSILVSIPLKSRKKR